MIHHTQRLFLVSLLCLFGLSAAEAQASKYTLQVEALDNPNPALKLVQKLKASGVDAYYLKSAVPGKGLYYRVRVGNFADTTAARRRGEQLCRAGLIRTYYVVPYEGKPVAFPNNIPSGYAPPSPPKKEVVTAHPVRPKQVPVIRRSAVTTCQGRASATRPCASGRRVRPARVPLHRPRQTKPAYVKCCWS
jgi:hypothetical protein